MADAHAYPVGVTVESWRLGDLVRVASGGTATIWRCSFQGQAQLFKRFNDDYLASLDAKVLSDLVEFPSTLRSDDRDRLLTLCAWPSSLVSADGLLVGVLMRPADEDFQTTRKGRLEPRHLTSLAVGRTVAHAQGREYFEMPHKLGRLGELLMNLRFLHRLQVVVGDLQPKNILTTGPALPGTAGPVRNLFIDCDSFFLLGRSAHEGMDPLPYKAPESTLSQSAQGVEFTVRSDLYKFALIAMRCIAEDLGAFEVSTDHLGRYLTTDDVYQLGTLLDGTGNFSDQLLEGLGRGWRSCVEFDGRLRGRESEVHLDGGPAGQAVGSASSSRWLQPWQIVVGLSLLLAISSIVVVLVYLQS
ncbi:hypothetical protein ABIB25_002285 [Nakamurella sp. UYEF19]